jgi:hypothetical protein
MENDDDVIWFHWGYTYLLYKNTYLSVLGITHISRVSWWYMRYVILFSWYTLIHWYTDIMIHKSDISMIRVGTSADTLLCIAWPSPVSPGPRDTGCDTQVMIHERYLWYTRDTWRDTWDTNHYSVIHTWYARDTHVICISAYHVSIGRGTRWVCIGCVSVAYRCVSGGRESCEVSGVYHVIYHRYHDIYRCLCITVCLCVLWYFCSEYQWYLLCIGRLVSCLTASSDTCYDTCDTYAIRDDIHVIHSWYTVRYVDRRWIFLSPGDISAVYHSVSLLRYVSLRIACITAKVVIHGISQWYMPWYTW